MVRESDKRAHKKFNREKMKAVTFRLHKVSDAELIEIYESIPDKMAWFRQALRNHKKGGE